MLDEQLLCARRALQSVLKTLHLLREVFFTLPPTQTHFMEEGTKKGTLAESIWSERLIR